MYRLRVIMKTGKEYIVTTNENDISQIITTMFGTRADSFALSTWGLHESDIRDCKCVILCSKDISSVEYGF